VSEFETITLTCEDNVATVTLNRPARLNAFNHKMVTEFGQLWQQLREDPEVHAIVLRAAGTRAFCSGMDVEAGPWWTHLDHFHQEDPGALLGPKTQHVWKPVITAVQGVAAGGAMYFINESDIVIAADDATFFDPHADAGIVSSLEPIGMLHRGVPLGDVLRWALVGTGERIGAETALRLGLVTEVVPASELWDRAADLATTIASRRPEAIQGTIRAIWESLDVAPSIAKRTGLAWTQLGNDGMKPLAERPRFGPPRIR
jgi:enoyl-CoA hydratase/carnithine racemase